MKNHIDLAKFYEMICREENKYTAKELRKFEEIINHTNFNPNKILYEEIQTTPLHCLVHRNKLPLIKILLKHNLINVNVKNIFNYTPFNMASCRLNVPLVKILLDENSYNANNKTRVDIGQLDCNGLSLFNKIITLNKINKNKLNPYECQNDQIIIEAMLNNIRDYPNNHTPIDARTYYYGEKDSFSTFIHALLCAGYKNLAIDFFKYAISPGSIIKFDMKMINHHKQNIIDYTKYIGYNNVAQEIQKILSPQQNHKNIKSPMLIANSIVNSRVNGVIDEEVNNNKTNLELTNIEPIISITTNPVITDKNQVLNFFVDQFIKNFDRESNEQGYKLF